MVYNLAATAVVTATTVVTATAIVAAADAGEQQDPDDPFTTSAVAVEQPNAVVAASVVAATSAIVVEQPDAIVAAAEEQKQDDPGAPAKSIVILCAHASAGIVASAVGSSQIAH